MMLVVSVPGVYFGFPEIRLSFIDDGIDGLVGNTALPRYKIFILLAVQN
jgi:hypothetical protein